MVSAMVCHGCGMVLPWFAMAFAMDLLWFCYDFAMVLVWVCQGVCHGFALPLLWFAMVFAMELLRKVRGAWLNGTSPVATNGCGCFSHGRVLIRL